ncbi:LicD family protein [Litoreibacter ponti]|uniref:LicD family protein n=1 Tax=Litoreibacter ponti TaxID=1510457 RepID=A0A2T6BMH0_9RHOB|nr:LicD family protein [Litoreibacter ponti]PTX57251.1 LicD family protein [Litoreibacter ponti]
MSTIETLQKLRDDSFRALRGEPVTLRPRQVVRRMDKMPPRLRKTNTFREAYVVNAALGRCRPAAANRHMAMLRDAHLKADTLYEYASFEAMLKEHLDGLEFGKHGFRERSLDDTDPKAVYASIQELIAVLRDLGYECFANSGTLLGLVRDGKLIPYDDDIDLAVLLKSTRDGAAASEFIALKQALCDRGLDCHMIKSGNPIIKLPSIDGFEVDLFPAYGAYSRYSIFPYARRTLHYGDVWPLQTCAVSGLPLPANPEVLLAENYGEDWRVPNQRFSFPWGPQKEKFSILMKEFSNGQ